MTEEATPPTDPLLDHVEKLRAGHGSDTQMARLQFLRDIWKPLTDYAHDLAAKYFPASKRLRIEFTISGGREPMLHFTTEHDRSTDPRRPDAKLESDWHAKYALKLFPRNQEALSLASQHYQDHDPDIFGVELFPGEMDAAKSVIEYWMAKQLAYEFDGTKVSGIPNAKLAVPAPEKPSETAVLQPQ